MAAVFVTAIVGVLGVVLGGRVLSGQAHDDQERRELRRFKYAGMVTVIVTAIGFEVRSRVMLLPAKHRRVAIVMVE